MATVYERFIKLGLAHSNPILQLAGQHVKEHFSYVSFVKRQERQGKHFYFVNDYDSTVTERIDKVILQWVKHKPSMLEQYNTSLWWKRYKGLDVDDRPSYRRRFSQR
jgi:hypothetical protein